MGELVVKDNALINASYHLDLVEQRLILLAIVAARQTGKGINAKEALTIHADSYATQFGVHRNTAYQALRDACNNLFDRQFSYQGVNEHGEIEYFKSRWVSRVSYVAEAAKVRLILAPDVVPLVTRLEQEFTKYDLDQVSGLSSSYSVRLYELLIQWRSVGRTPVLELEEFRRHLGVPENQYIRLEAFRRRVLDISINQINEHTDITASYGQQKSGRIITGFTFDIKLKKAKKAAKIEDKAPKKQKKETQLDWVDLSKPVFSAEALKMSSDFDSLADGHKTLILKNIENELKGLRRSEFIVELSAYNAKKSPVIFEQYKDYFSRSFALLGCF